MAQVALPPPGPRRARALLRQSQLCFDDVLAGLHLCAQALDQPGLTADLRAEIHLRRAEIESAALIRVDETIASFEAAANAGPSAALRAVAIAGAAYYRFRAGEPLDEKSLANAIALADAAGGDGVYALPRALRAFAVATLDLNRARPLFEIELRRAEERGDDVAVTAHRLHLAALEVSAGRFAAARMHLARADPRARIAGVFERHLTLQAAIEAAVGNVEEARAAAARAAAEAADAGDALALALSRGAIATLELSLGDPAAAWQALSQAAKADAAEANPVLVRLLPDAAEALAELGRLDEAESIARRLEDARPVLGRSRGAALRARAVVAAPSDVDGALRTFDEALDEHRRLGSAFDEARTLFARGRVLRRARRRRLARESLADAAALFERLGARLWAERTRRELERTGTRPVRGDELTPSEAQVARLAASGRTNREIAQALFVSPKTVEAALSRVYRKLEIRSRSELAARRTSL